MSNTVAQMCTSKLLTSSQNLLSLGVSIYLVIVSSIVINDVNAWRDHTKFDVDHATDMNDDGVEKHDLMGLAVSTVVGSSVYFLWNVYFSIRALTDDNHTDLYTKDEKNRRDILTVSGFQTVVVSILLVLYCVLWGGFEHDRENNADQIWQGERSGDGSGSASDLQTLTLAAWIALSVNLLTCLIDLFMLCRSSRK